MYALRLRRDWIAALAGPLLLSAPALADDAALIETALSAAPPQVAAIATVKDYDGRLLREGGETWTCYAPVGMFKDPMCNDATFDAWLGSLLKGEAPAVDRVGISYMLAGDSPEGGASNIDPMAEGPTADNQWVVEGPHLMMIVPDRAALSALPTTPVEDGPYVMWPDTPYAHIMLPIAQRGAQRPVE